MTNITRRGAVSAAFWMVPAVTLATSAPAFALSTPGASCVLVGYKKPGKGKNAKDYYLTATCKGGKKVEAVCGVWGKKVFLFKKEGEVWVSRGNKASNSKIVCTVKYTDGTVEVVTVKFDPYEPQIPTPPRH